MAQNIDGTRFASAAQVFTGWTLPVAIWNRLNDHAVHDVQMQDDIWTVQDDYDVTMTDADSSAPVSLESYHDGEDILMLDAPSPNPLPKARPFRVVRRTANAPTNRSQRYSPSGILYPKPSVATKQRKPFIPVISAAPMAGAVSNIVVRTEGRRLPKAKMLARRCQVIHQQLYQPTSQPLCQLPFQSPSRFPTQPPSQPLFQTRTQPPTPTQLPSQPTSQAAIQPPLRLTSHPTSQPSSQLPVQPPTQSPTEPPSQPSPHIRIEHNIPSPARDLTAQWSPTVLSPVEDAHARFIFDYCETCAQGRRDRDMIRNFYARLAAQQPPAYKPQAMPLSFAIACQNGTSMDDSRWRTNKLAPIPRGPETGLNGIRTSYDEEPNVNRPMTTPELVSDMTQPLHQVPQTPNPKQAQTKTGLSNPHIPKSGVVGIPKEQFSSSSKPKILEPASGDLPPARFINDIPAVEKGKQRGHALPKKPEPSKPVAFEQHTRAQVAHDRKNKGHELELGKHRKVPATCIRSSDRKANELRGLIHRIDERFQRTVLLLIDQCYGADVRPTYTCTVAQGSPGIAADNMTDAFTYQGSGWTLKPMQFASTGKAIHEQTKRAFLRELEELYDDDQYLWIELMSMCFQHGLHPRDLFSGSLAGERFSEETFEEEPMFDNVLFDNSFARKMLNIDLDLGIDELLQPGTRVKALFRKLQEQDLLAMLQAFTTGVFRRAEDDGEDAKDLVHEAMYKSGLTWANDNKHYSSFIKWLKDWEVTIAGQAMNEDSDTDSQEWKSIIETLGTLVRYRYPRCYSLGAVSPLSEAMGDTAFAPVDSDSENDDVDTSQQSKPEPERDEQGRPKSTTKGQCFKREPGKSYKIAGWGSGSH